MTAQLAQRIRSAKQQGSTDEEILQSLEQRLPNLAKRIQRAREQKIEDKDILGSILNRFETQQPQQQTEQIQQPDQDQRDQTGFLDFIQGQGPLASSSLNFLKAIGKGGAQGLLNFARGFGVRTDTEEGKFQNQFEPIENLIEQIPVEETNVLGPLGLDIAGLAQRGARLSIGALGDPTGFIRTSAGPRSLAASTISGQAAKELGFGETGQAVSEFFGGVAPQNFLKKRPTVVPKKNQKLFLDSARKMGLSEEEIAPLLQSDSKINNFLIRFSTKKGRASEELKRSRDAITNSIKELENKPEAEKIIDPNNYETFIQNLRNTFREIPAQAREPLIGDLADLSQSPRNLKSALNFYRDINFQLGKGNDRVGTLKGPILSLFRKESPNLALDLELTNDLFATFSDVARKFKPTDAEKFLRGSRPARLLWGIFSGKKSIIGEVLGETVGSRVAAQLTTNPRFKNLGLQFAKAINQNKFNQAQIILNRISNDLRKENPEAAEQIDLIQIDEIFKDQKN